MVPSNAAPAKVCVSCKVDVTNAPRMKDPQGRYYCQACASKATKSSPSKPVSVVAPAVSGNQDFMAKIIDEAAEKASHTCPSCQHPIAPDAKLCTGCGFNLANGKKVMTKVTRDLTKEKSVKSAAKLSDNAMYQFVAWSDWGIATIIAVPLAICAVLVFVQPPFLALYLLIQSICAISVALWLIIDAFRQSFVRGLLCIFIPGFYWLLYGLALTENSRLKAAYITCILTSIVGTGLKLAFPDALDFNTP